MNRNMIAQRVREAREERGFNQTELAQLLGWKSHSSIVAIEQGTKELKMWELLKIAQALNVQPESLYSEISIKVLSPTQILWRGRESESAAMRNEEQHIYQHCEDYRLLERLIPSTFSLPRTLPQRDFDIQKADIECANRLADELYRELNLGDYPAEVLARRLEEDFGVILLRRPLECGSAACLRSGNDVVIVTNANDAPWRQVFSLAHELFHAITWNDLLLQQIKNDDSLFRKNEQLADAFAAALMMPQQMIERDLHDRKLTYSLIVASARQYGVSTSAMLWRLRHLRFLTADVVKAVLADNEFKLLDQSTYNKARKSAISFGGRFLRLAYLAFESGRLSKSRLARMLGVNLQDLDMYLSTNGFELTHDKEIVADID